MSTFAAVVAGQDSSLCLDIGARLMRMQSSTTIAATGYCFDDVRARGAPMAVDPTFDF